MKDLEHKLKQKEFRKMLRKEHSHNVLHRYCKFMKNYVEVGFDYNSAKNYVINLLRLR